MQSSSHLSLGVISCAVFLCSCNIDLGETKEEKKPTFDDSAIKALAFLTNTDLSYANSEEVKEDEISEEINSNRYFFDSPPAEVEKKEQEEDEDPDFTKCLKSGLSGKFELKENTLTYQSNAKTYKCTSKTIGEVTLERLQVALRFQCEALAEDAKALEGKTYEQARNSELAACQPAKESRGILQMYTKISFPEFQSETSGKTSTTKAVFSNALNVSAANNEPCGTKNYESNCINTRIDLSEVTTDGVTTKTARREVLTDEKLISADGKPKYYVSGKFLLDYLGWSGSAIYTGADIPPTWTLSKNGITKTGTFEYGKKATPASSSSASLTDLNTKVTELTKAITSEVRFALVGQGF